MSIDWNTEIQNWESSVRSGGAVRVKKEISNLQKSEIPQVHLEKIANLSWRVGCPEVGLKIIYKKIRLDQVLRVTSHPGIFLEYACCLIELGAYQEGERILNQLLKSQERSHFVMAASFLRRWDYRGAKTQLEEFLKVIKNPYQRLVAQVNLLSVYVHLEDHEQAIQLGSALQKELAEKEYTLLLGNCLEILSQVHFQRGDHLRSLQLLRQAEGHLISAKNSGWVFCKKWQLINNLFLGQSSKEELRAQFIETRKLALGLKSWETIRDIDFYWAISQKDQYFLDRVYFGSGSLAYRSHLDHLRKKYDVPMSPSENFVWDSKARRSLNEVIGIEDLLKDKKISGDLPRKLFKILMSDFYSPFRTGQFYSLLFPNDYFDFENSSNKVSQLIARLRIFLVKQGENFDIKQTSGFYRLVSLKDIGIQFNMEDTNKISQSKAYARLDKIKNEFGTQEFSTAALMNLFESSARSINRLVKTLVEEGLVVSTGQKRAIRYRVV